MRESMAGHCHVAELRWEEKATIGQYRSLVQSSPKLPFAFHDSPEAAVHQS